jgi:hypothetical protein
MVFSSANPCVCIVFACCIARIAADRSFDTEADLAERHLTFRKQYQSNLEIFQKNRKTADEFEDDDAEDGEVEENLASNLYSLIDQNASLLSNLKNQDEPKLTVDGELSKWMVRYECEIHNVDTTYIREWLETEFNADQVLGIYESGVAAGNEHWFDSPFFKDPDDGTYLHYKAAYYRDVIQKTIVDTERFYQEYNEKYLMVAPDSKGMMPFTRDTIEEYFDDPDEKREAISKARRWRRNIGARSAFVLKKQGKVAGFVLISHVKGDVNTRIMDILDNGDQFMTTTALLLYVMAMEIASLHEKQLRKLKVQAVVGPMVTYFSRFAFMPVTFSKHKELTPGGDFWELHMTRTEMVSTRDFVDEIGKKDGDVQTKVKNLLHFNNEYDKKYEGGFDPRSTK